MGRKVEFVGGRRITATPQEVADMWLKHTKLIPVQFALGTAQHESDFTLNEVDTEESGYVSKGIYQIADSEADSVKHHGANLLDLEDATIVMVAIMEQKYDVLMHVAYSITDDFHDDDRWAYLFIAHNQGLTAAIKSIKRYGLDWAAYKKRNGHIVKDGFDGPATCAYGDDVVTGGTAMAQVTLPKATVELASK